MASCPGRSAAPLGDADVDPDPAAYLVIAKSWTPRLRCPGSASRLAALHRARGTTDDAQLGVRPPERSLHLAADAHGVVVRVKFHVRPFQPLALGNVALELDVLRKAEREIAVGERDVRRASACPRRRSRPRRPAPRPVSGCAWRWRRRRSGSPTARRSARGGAPRSRPRCRARARSCGSAGTARRNGRCGPAAWRIPKSSGARIRSRPRSRRRCRARDDAARPCRRDRPTT